ncbi:hypothetical protein [Chitinolyticbacter meiyuanensis]|uniref:hypothetical protein n=1 Tax=Chitinolyticbacter meiyuanensis TaxID=682798 RepID=UPI0011E59E7F|nr:hypothetical protein [Chitinolyticbacter meiyuanensis]
MRSLIIVVALLLTACASEPKVTPPPRLATAESAMKAAQRAWQGERYADAAASWQVAFEAYRSIDHWPGQGEARLGLAQAFSRQGETAAARNVLLGMPEQALFPAPLRTRAAYQLALLAVSAPPEADARLAQARALCAAPCAVSAQLDNLEARLNLQRDPALAAQRVAAVLVLGEVAPAAERAHALRLQAELLLNDGDATTARISLLQAITIDKQLAESMFLADDFALLVRVQQALGDAAGQREAEARLASLCAAFRAPACRNL